MLLPTLLRWDCWSSHRPDAHAGQLSEGASSLQWLELGPVPASRSLVAPPPCRTLPR